MPRWERSWAGMAARSIASPPQGTANSAPVLPRCRLLCRRPPGARTGSSGRALIRRASLRTQGGQLPLRFRKSLLFRCVSPFRGRARGGNKAEKRAFSNSFPALSGGARVSVWARPGAIRPGRGAAGCPLVASSVPPLRPVCSRGAPGGAPSPAADRRAVPPFRARFRRAPPGRSARRSALRAPAPVLCACPPRGFCPSMMDSRPVSSRVWGCSASFRASARCARSRSGLVPGA